MNNYKVKVNRFMIWHGNEILSGLHIGKSKWMRTKLVTLDLEKAIRNSAPIVDSEILNQKPGE